MKRVVAVSFIIFAFAWLFLSPTPALAAHDCFCTSTCTGTCVNRPPYDVCSTSPLYRCTSFSECNPVSATGLYYTNSNLDITLGWDANSLATEYLVAIIPESTGVITEYSTGTSTTYDFTAAPGESYTWYVKVKNYCYWPVTWGPSINIPSVGSVTLAYGEAESCTDGGCNGQDMIVGLDKANRDQKVPIRVTASDGNGADNIAYVYVLFDNNSEYADGTLIRVRYNNDSNAWDIQNEEPSNISEYPDPKIKVNYVNETVSGNTLILDFVLDFSGLPKEDYFLSNIYVNVVDKDGFSTGRVRKVGAGNFDRIPVDPYTDNPLEALDIWNGKDVAVKNVGFYQTSFDNLNLQSGSEWKGTEILTGIGLSTSYDPENLIDWALSLPNWISNTYYQPYYHYNNADNKILYSPDSNASIILTGMNNLLYGGDSVEAVNGVVTNNFKNGGVRTGDSEVGNTSYETAFSVIQVSGGWSQIYDGSLFANGNFDLNIEPTTCDDPDVCVLMKTLTPTTNNGLLLVNGVIDAKDTVNYGEVTNWYAQTQSSIAPFNDFVIDKNYDQIKALFAPDTFTELTTSSTIVDGNIGTDPLGPNQTYFVNGNLTILDNSLNVTDGNYLLFVVNGDLTIASTVKDVAEDSAVEGMFIVLKNNSGSGGNIYVKDDDSDSTDDVITIEGALVAEGTINFERSLYTQNNYQPPVKVVFRPDMLGKMAENKVSIFEIQKKLVSQY